MPGRKVCSDDRHLHYINVFLLVSGHRC
jgi:hypothetical protein